MCTWMRWALAGVTAVLAATAAAGEPVEMGQFGRPLPPEDSSGVEWDMPRDVTELRVPAGQGTAPGSLRVQWWGSVWPAGGTGGWMRLDDPWNGSWVNAAGTWEPQAPGGIAFRFAPLAGEEWPHALKAEQYPGGAAPAFRKTLKVRVVSEDGAPVRDIRLEVYGRSVWREAQFDIETRLAGDVRLRGRLEVTNGVLLGLESLGPPRGVLLEGHAWTARRDAAATGGVRVIVRYADNEDLNSNDLTLLTVRFGEDARATGFSVLPQDVLREGVVRLPDFGTIVSDTSRRITLANDAGPGSGRWRKPVRRRLAEQPEQTREHALAGIPRLAPARWAPIGVPSARQEFFVGPNGDWAIWGGSLHTTGGRDTPRLVFRQRRDDLRRDELYALLDTRAEPAFDGRDREGIRRWLQDGHLPLVHAQWTTGPVRYLHSLLATTLTGAYEDDVGRRGDETVALLTKLVVTNASDRPATATVNLRFSHAVPLELAADGTILVRPVDGSDVPEGLCALRGRISMDVPAGGGADGWRVISGDGGESADRLRWQAELAPGGTRTVYFAAPFVDLLDATEHRELLTRNFERESAFILGYWRDRLARGMLIDVPDTALNDFYRANLWHIAITTDRDPVTGLYNQGVGTVQYRVFANETVMIARSMDMRGEHLEARRFMEPLLHYQGTEALKGRFSTAEGAFHGAGEYTHGEYAMNHGFVLWGVAEHYLMTQDRAYLERVAPKLVKGCDFLVRERRLAMQPGAGTQPPVHGLAPASSLEDVVEYQYWFATNAYFYLGLKRAAQALAAIGHGDAERFGAEAEAYRRAIEAAAREAATRSAAVPLRDGMYIPYVPSRVYQWRHLTEGWIREALYCALHLAAAEVVDPADPLMTWMLDDLEDNIFFSWQSGYNVSDYEKTWFEKGAVTLQPCLLDTPIVYMARDEVPAALRSFWNTYALSIYPDVQCFAEWARRFGQGAGPVYKTSDEARFVMWLRQLLVWEDGRTLWFGRGAPRAWLEDGKTIRVERAVTLFGTAGLTIRSEAARGRIHAEVTVPERDPPSEVWLRLRHPEGLAPRRVLVGGVALDRERLRGEDILLMPGAPGQAGPLSVTAEYR